MIKFRSGYDIHRVLNEHLIVGTDSETYMPNCIMSLNETSLFLYNILKDGADEETLIEKLVAEYDVEKADAELDIQAFLQRLKDRNMLDDVVGGGNGNNGGNDGGSSGDGEYVTCSCGEVVLKSDLNKHMKKCPNNPYK